MSASNTSRRLRSASLKLLDADVPPGMWNAAGTAAAQAPSVASIRRGSLGNGSTSGNGKGRSNSLMSGKNGPRRMSFNGLAAESNERGNLVQQRRTATFPATQPLLKAGGEDAMPLSPVPSFSAPEFQYSDDNHPRTRTPTPTPSHASTQQTTPLLPPRTTAALALSAFTTWLLTPSGILITLYALNVVAWGGMLFLLLCNAAPAMCTGATDPCNGLDSARRVWIEIDSQILNALFCVTGFGLVPWRARDLWWWGVWRFGWGKGDWGASKAERKAYGMRVLAGVHRAWFRLPVGGTDAGDVGDVAAVKALPVPRSGVRAPPTRAWKLDAVVWCNVWNTLLQACLCGFMWGMDRFERPSWSTGLFIGLACVVAGTGGLVVFVEGKRVKKVEDGEGNSGEEMV